MFCLDFDSQLTPSVSLFLSDGVLKIRGKINHFHIRACFPLKPCVFGFLLLVLISFCVFVCVLQVSVIRVRVPATCGSTEVRTDLPVRGKTAPRHPSIHTA